MVANKKIIGKIEILFGLLILLILIPYLYYTINTIQNEDFFARIPKPILTENLNLSNDSISIIEVNSAFFQINTGVMGEYFKSTTLIMWLLGSSIIGILGVILILQGLANIRN